MLGAGVGAAFCAAQKGTPIPAARAAVATIRMLFRGISMPDVTTPAMRLFADIHVYTVGTALELPWSDGCQTRLQKAGMSSIRI
jgi:hypothetical protein